MRAAIARQGRALCCSAMLLACGEAAPSAAVAESTAAPDEATVRAILALPEQLELPAIPDYNPVSREKIELGRHLFYDPALSANQTQACSSCHLQEHAFADAKRTPTGSTGDVLVRNSPGLANAFYHATLTWSHDALIDLEQQLEVPLRNDQPTELGISDGKRDEVLSRFGDDPKYQRLFAAAFPEATSAITLRQVVFALASFCRSLVSADSPYDRYRAGDKSALSASQRRGLGLFNGERLECFHCHTGTNLSVSYRDANTTPGTARSPFFNNGLYDVDGTGSYPERDQGLYDLTFNPRDRGLFRPPSLRNVALTAPYMHDGSLTTLRDVLRHYAAGGTVTPSGPFAGDGRTSRLKSGLVRGFELTDSELDDVVAFLEALTDRGFVENPAFASPF